MLSDPEAQHSPTDWYLIASRGDLVLRLAQDLQIGEDGNGGIVLSPAREDALLRISVRDGELTLQALAMDWTFCDRQGSTRQHVTFPAGSTVKMHFPTCSLVITPDFRAGERAAPDCELDLRPTTPPTVALTRLSEPITLVDQPAVTWQTLPPIGVATTEEVAALLEAGAEDAYERLLDGDHDVPDETSIEIPLLQAQVPAPVQEGSSGLSPIRARAVAPGPSPSDTGDATPSTTSRVTSQRQAAAGNAAAHRALAAVVAALVLLIPMALLLDAPEELGVHLPSSGYLEPGQVVEPLWPEDPPPAPVVTRRAAPAIEPTVTVSEPVIEAAPSAVGETLAAEPSPLEDPLPVADRPDESPAPERTLSDAEAARVAALLVEAQALYDAGAIVTPVHENAVSRLTQVLRLDPTNEAGLALMYDSALRLTEEAQAAHDAGDDYLARNLLEDVLGFHPDFEMARKLQQDWRVNGNG
ncbi:MAG: hypothetical protein AB7I04_05195 [Pseudomonadales bacterium]